MINEKMDAFINYNYRPFSKAQCIGRLLCLWLLSTIIGVIGKGYVTWLLVLGLINVLVSGLFVYQIFRYSHSKISRFLNDGIFYYYLSVLFIIAAYRLLTQSVNANFVLLLILLTIQHLSLIIFLIIVLLNIKSDKYMSPRQNRNTIFPFASGILGMLTAKLFLQDQPLQSALSLLATVLLVLSIMTSIGSLNLLKAWMYYRREHK